MAQAAIKKNEYKAPQDNMGGKYFNTNKQNYLSNVEYQNISMFEHYETDDKRIRPSSKDQKKKLPSSSAFLKQI